jgi:hypothetical protein
MTPHEDRAALHPRRRPMPPVARAVAPAGSPRMAAPAAGFAPALAAALLAVFAPAGVDAAACGEALGASVARADGERWTVAWRADPSPIPVGRHFALDIEVCPRASVAMPAKLDVDATMPAHRHGMNSAPTVKATAPGRWRAEGLLFHMPGRWELLFAAGSARSDRVAADVDVR